MPLLVTVHVYIRMGGTRATAVMHSRVNITYAVFSGTRQQGTYAFIHAC